MAWKLSENNFAVVPEGKHVFKVTKFDWDADFGKLAFTLETKEGYKLIERYSLLTENGEVNEKANNAFSYFARAVLDDQNVDEIEFSDLVGKFIEADVTHDIVPSKKDPSKKNTFAHLGNTYHAKGFETEEQGDNPFKDDTDEFDLDEILG